MIILLQNIVIFKYCKSVNQLSQQCLNDWISLFLNTQLLNNTIIYQYQKQQYLEPHFNKIHKIIIDSLKRNNIHLSLTAYKTFVSIVIAITNVNDLKKYQ